MSVSPQHKRSGSKPATPPSGPAKTTDSDHVHLRSHSHSHSHPAWVSQQIRAFSAWINNLLPGAVHEQYLMTDLADGTVLIKLVEHLDQQSPSDPPLFKSYHVKPKLTFHRTENIEMALNHLRQQGLQLVGITAQAIESGNVKAVLGLVWLLIQKYDINESMGILGSAGEIDTSSTTTTATTKQNRQLRLSVDNESVSSSSIDVSSPRSPNNTTSAKNRLLQWCEISANEQVDVENVDKTLTPTLARVSVTSFSSLSDGLVFALLINRLHSSLLDIRALLTRPPRDRLLFVCQAAESSLGIPLILDVDEFATNPNSVDTQSLMTYLAFFKNYRRQKVWTQIMEARRQAATLNVESTRPTSLSATQRQSHSSSFSTSKSLDTDTQQQLEAARKTISELKATITHMQREGEKHAEITQPESPSTQHQQLMTMAQVQLAPTKEAEEEIARLQQQIKKLSDENQQQKQRITALESAASASTAAASSPELHQLEQALAAGLATAKASASAQQESELLLEEFKSTAEASQQQATALAAQVKELQAEREKDQQQLLAATNKEKDKAAQQSHIDKDKKMQQDLQQLESALAQQLTIAKENKQQQEQQAHALNDLMQTHQASIVKAKALEAQVQQLESERTQYTKQIQQLQQELTQAASAIKQTTQKQAETLKAAKSAANTTTTDDTYNPLPAASASPGILSKHEFDLRQLAKEKDNKIQQLHDRIKQLELSAKAAHKEEAEHQQAVHEQELLITQLQEGMRQQREINRKDKQQIEEMQMQQKQRDESYHHQQQVLQQKLESSTQILLQNRNEIDEAKKVKQQRTHLERNLREEKEKNRQLQMSIDQMKKSRASSSVSSSPVPIGNKQKQSLSQRTSRQTSRDVSPSSVHSRSFQSIHSSAPSSSPDTDVDYVSPATQHIQTTDDDHADAEADADVESDEKSVVTTGSNNQKKKKKKKKGVSQHGRSDSSSSYAINVQMSSSQSNSPTSRHQQQQQQLANTSLSHLRIGAVGAVTDTNTGKAIGSNCKQAYAEEEMSHDTRGNE